MIDLLVAFVLYKFNADWFWWVLYGFAIVCDSHRQYKIAVYERQKKEELNNARKDAFEDLFLSKYDRDTDKD